MIKLGKTQTLQVARHSDFGVYLFDSNSSREDQILLPKGQVPEGLDVDDKISVFVYKDTKDRFIATTETPALELGEVALLTVEQVTEIGAFLQWGLLKDLLLPFKEQTKEVKAGEEVLVALYVDKTNRLCATMKLYDFLSTNSPYKRGDTVQARVYEINNSFGVFLAVDNQYSALIPKQQVFQPLIPGMEVTARVNQLRDDGKLTLCLQEKSFIQMDEDAKNIYDRLSNSPKGMLPFHDKTDPEIIKREFHISKNAFKRAIGRLMKEKKIRIEKDGIYLITENKM